MSISAYPAVTDFAKENGLLGFRDPAGYCAQQRQGRFNEGPEESG